MCSAVSMLIGLAWKTTPCLTPKGQSQQAHFWRVSTRRMTVSLHFSGVQHIGARRCIPTQPCLSKGKGSRAKHLRTHQLGKKACGGAWMTIYLLSPLSTPFLFGDVCVRQRLSCKAFLCRGQRFRWQTPPNLAVRQVGWKNQPVAQNALFISRRHTCSTRWMDLSVLKWQNFKNNKRAGGKQPRIKVRLWYRM